MSAVEPKKITILYFAHFREQRGLLEETIATTAATADELYRDLADAHGFVYDTETIRVAINEELQDWGSIINDGDTVTLLAPYGGGD